MALIFLFPAGDHVLLGPSLWNSSCNSLPEPGCPLALLKHCWWGQALHSFLERPSLCSICKALCSSCLGGVIFGCLSASLSLSSESAQRRCFEQIYVQWRKHSMKTGCCYSFIYSSTAFFWILTVGSPGAWWAKESHPEVCIRWGHTHTGGNHPESM